MPKIDVNKELFKKLFSKDLSRDYLESVLPVAKAEFDGEDENSIKVELNDTNRPDLWGTVGLSRLLSSYYKKKEFSYSFFSTPKQQKKTKYEFLIGSSRPDERPYSVGFLVKGKKLTDEMLKMLIGMQEKIHNNYGRKRKSISMGLYRSDAITFPVIYKGSGPEENSFVPLHESEQMTLREVVEKTPKGKEFGALIKDFKVWPYLCDSAGKTLSLPPIINSNDVGALEVGDSEIFIEINGVYLKQVLLVANIFACDFADLGFEIIPCKVKFPEPVEGFGSEIVVPYYFQDPIEVTKEEVAELLSDDISLAECPKYLKKMGVESSVKGKKLVAKIPPYRNDYLAPSDVVEDVAIGFGLNSFDKEMLNDFTVGRLSEAENYNRKLTKLLVGLGFSEMIFNYLSSEKEYVDNMLGNVDDCIVIANAMSLNYKVVRPSILPSLLHAESSSSTATYPHRIFETGKICVKDEQTLTGTRTINSLGILESSTEANYNRCLSIINSLFYYLDLSYNLKNTSDPRFIKGRAVELYVGEEKIGVLGEVNPVVLENFSITMPSFAIELNVDKLIEVNKNS